MSRDLVRDPAPAGLARAARAPTACASPRPTARRSTSRPPARAAYPPGHPDYADIPDPDRPELELEELMSGRLLGPLLRCSGARGGGGRARCAGAVLVNGQPGEPPFGGPWISPGLPPPGRARRRRRRCCAARSRIATRDGLPARRARRDARQPGARASTRRWASPTCSRRSTSSSERAKAPPDRAETARAYRVAADEADRTGGPPAAGDRHGARDAAALVRRARRRARAGHGPAGAPAGAGGRRGRVRPRSSRSAATARRSPRSAPPRRPTGRCSASPAAASAR